MTGRPSSTAGTLGTFAGVFRPIVLTVLGAMLYLREGWLVANAGLLGALCVIGAAYLITGTTAASLATIATNVRVARGGPFAIVSRALGLEAGGAIGVPLFLAQSISSVMYLYAFTEGWAHLYPSHDSATVALVAFVGVAAVALASADLAARAQAVMLGVVAAALISALGGIAWVTPEAPVWIGRFPEAGPLDTFAIFFPAATGIMVGAGMSGELADPRRALPRGTLGAWAVTLVVYVVFAFWYAAAGTTEELLSNGTILVERAAVGPVVLAGLLSSTLMAALSSLVAAPRLLQAMAEYRIVPCSEWLARSHGGEPRRATLATLGIASLGLMAGSLNAIAPVITSCFLLTYLAINAVVYLEQLVGMVSFRPTWSVPRWVPALGMVSSLLALGLTSPAGGGLFEVLGVTALYLWLVSRRLETPWETVHSGLAMAIATGIARHAMGLQHSERSWRPDWLVPVAHPREIELLAPIVRATTRLHGSVKFVALVDLPELRRALELEVDRLLAADRFASWHLGATDPPALGVRLAMALSQGSLFSSNLLLLTPALGREALQSLRVYAQGAGVGVGLFFPAAKHPTGQDVHVWLSDRAPEWEVGLHLVNTDLPVLLAWLASYPVGGRLTLHCVVGAQAHARDAEQFLATLVEQGRLPTITGTRVHTEPFLEALGGIGGDLHLLGLADVVDLERLGAIRRAVGAPCLFLADSGQESLLA